MKNIPKKGRDFNLFSNRAKRLKWKKISLHKNKILRFYSGFNFTTPMTFPKEIKNTKIKWFPPQITENTT